LVGDLQWLWVPSLRQGASKLAPTWYGPYRVAKRPTAHTAVLQGQGGRYLTTSVHIARLKPYTDPTKRPYVDLIPTYDTTEGSQEGWQSVDPIKNPPLLEACEPQALPAQSSPLLEEAASADRVVESEAVDSGQLEGSNEVEAPLPPPIPPETIARKEGLRPRPQPTVRYKPSQPQMKNKRSVPLGDGSIEPSSKVLRATVQGPPHKNKKPLHDTSEQCTEYTIQFLRDVRHDPHRGTLYRVRWLGYPPEYDTWEPEANLPADLIQSYKASLS